ncbi:hypothetical protein F4553_008002 [Allocatelliglobosispora scoriae]|uniref:Guanylate cyclase domain-containing protein n=1 Tax=Allocatelliglobosispora scoriae TaxID=643052 RepID=A0A841C463_9ACTN|nr:CATRA conflict system CASPASE/TPR repeat-associated protein [Allocatelliglobosispora scoriae]MBB5874568.1 hypothetical protein [Allocatelliglobosispora scoriae]
MPAAEPSAQELVVHAYAPLDGPAAAPAYAQLRAVWTAARQLFGADRTIAGTGLPASLPDDPGSTPDGALAGQETLVSDCQLILRRSHDTLALSLAFAETRDTGWADFDRRWTEATRAGTDSLLGIVQLFLACSSNQTDSPGAEWRHPTRIEPFTVWDSDSGTRATPSRRLAILAPAAELDALSAWAWSRGDVAMPPLARYLLHAAKISYHARVWSADRSAEDARRRTDQAVAELLAVVAQPGRGDHSAALRTLQAARVDLSVALSRLREMQASVEIIRDNMRRYLPDPLPADTRLADWLTQQLADAAGYLDLSRQRAAEIAELVRQGPVGDDPPRRASRSPVAVRVGFAVDIVNYSSRTAPLKREAQSRVAQLIDDVLDDLELTLNHTDHQTNGDGANIFLPVATEMHRAVPQLLHSWRDRLAADNARHTDRIRLRLVVGIGPIETAPLGFGGNTIIEVSRLLDSDVIREAVTADPDRDLIALISNQLYQWVVGEGHTGIEADHLRQVTASAKSFTATAWFWAPDEAP